jgi:hypothetical protein
MITAGKRFFPARRQKSSIVSFTRSTRSKRTWRSAENGQNGAASDLSCPQLYRMYRKLPKKPKQQRRRKQLRREKEWSGREDLNLRPPGPETKEISQSVDFSIHVSGASTVQTHVIPARRSHSFSYGCPRVGAPSTEPSAVDWTTLTSQNRTPPQFHLH